MAKVTSAQRRLMPSSNFALRRERKYLIHDRSHAANAKGRATQQLKAGNLTKAQYKMITSKANAKLKATAPKTRSKPLSRSAMKIRR